jgi:hypothetical protein
MPMFTEKLFPHLREIDEATRSRAAAIRIQLAAVSVFAVFRASKLEFVC